MSKKALHNVDNSVLRYSNCWEDADVLLAALKPQPGDRIISIGSAGDNSFSLLTGNPAEVMCVDVNRTQLNLIKLKIAVFKTLSHQEFLIFLGFKTGDRQMLFNRVKEVLEPEVNTFWDQHLELIIDGLIYQGKFEKYLLVFQRKILPLIHTKKAIKRLFEAKPDKDQAHFYNTKWNSFRWKVFTRIFFSRKVLGWGRDPVFLKQVKGFVGKQIKARIDAHLSSRSCQHNYFLRFMLSGKFGNHLPHYARLENFETIKKQVDKLKFFEGPLEDLPNNQGYNKANLSNIFEYLDGAVIDQNQKALLGLLEPGSILAYWNLLVPVDLTSSFPRHFSVNETEKPLHDYGFFYRKFHVNKRL